MIFAHDVRSAGDDDIEYANADNDVDDAHDLFS